MHACTHTHIPLLIQHAHTHTQTHTRSDTHSTHTQTGAEPRKPFAHKHCSPIKLAVNKGSRLCDLRRDMAARVGKVHTCPFSEDNGHGQGEGSQTGG